MRKRVAFVSGAVAALGLAAAVLGFVSEWAKSKVEQPALSIVLSLFFFSCIHAELLMIQWSAQAFVRQDGQRCVYQRTAAFGCGIAAAVLAILGVASGWFGRYGGATAPGYRRSAASLLPVIAW
jgi:hypothetical protein